MIEKKLTIADDCEHAERISRAQDNELSWQERFEAFMKLMEPYYAAAGGLQRVYRVDDRKQRQIRDDWGLCVQPVSKSTRNR